MIDDQYVLAGNGWVVVRDGADGRLRAAAPPPMRDDDRDARWRARYSRAYSYQDDPTYTECRREVDPAGAIVGALVGGLLGNAAGPRRDKAVHGRGCDAGGAIGAALSTKMNCEDRGYAYRTYSQGFNAGRVNATYEWRNPDNDHRGKFHVLDYYRDEDGFRCSVFSHEIWVGGRPEEARGRACQQPDGSWAIID